MAHGTIDLDATVYEVCKEHPEVKDVMAGLGFDEITKPGRLQTMGRVMTLRKGSQAKGVELGEVVAALQDAGFDVAGFETSAKAAEPAASGEPDEAAEPAADVASGPSPFDFSTAEGRQRRLEQLVRRLSDGEGLEAVREEFVRDFASVSAEEIAAAEQSLIEGGMPVREVQRLCDVHSALFHGRTDAECSLPGADRDGLPAGHPVSALRLENDELVALLDELDALLAEGSDAERMHGLLATLKELKRHYGKKEELLMPLLYAYGFTGPSDVMWGVDDEIYHEVSALAKVDAAELLPACAERLSAVSARAREMVYKEEQILFPLCLEHLTRDEWYAVYRDLGEFGWAFGVEGPHWLDGDVWVGLQARATGEAPADGKVRLSTGELSVAQLEAVLKLLPVDLTFIDETETTRFFTNEGKVFARPLSCLGRAVWSCHPPQIVPMVKAMIADFKAGRRDRMEVWTPDAENPTRVLYVPVWGEGDTYLGTLEIVQQFGELLPRLQEALA